MSALLLALLLQASPAHAPEAAASPTPAAEHAAEAAAPHVPADAHATAAGAPEHGADAGHGDPATVIMHHATDGPLKIGPLVLPSKHLVFLFAAAALMILIAQLAVRSYRGGEDPSRPRSRGRGRGAVHPRRDRRAQHRS
jgi:hypothetical protein